MRKPQCHVTHIFSWVEKKNSTKNKTSGQTNVWQFCMFASKSYCSELVCILVAQLVGFDFNGPVNTIKVMLSQSVYLTTLFLGRLSPLNG